VTLALELTDDIGVGTHRWHFGIGSRLLVVMQAQWSPWSTATLLAMLSTTGLLLGHGIDCSSVTNYYS